MAKQKKKKGVYYTNLRLPHEVADSVKEAAKANRRSINGEIEYTLSEKYV